MSKKKKNWIGKIFTITGLLLFAAALALSVYNLWDDYGQSKAKRSCWKNIETKTRIFLMRESRQKNLTDRYRIIS